MDGGVLRSQDVSDGSARFKDRLQVQPKPGEPGVPRKLEDRVGQGLGEEDFQERGQVAKVDAWLERSREGSLVEEGLRGQVVPMPDVPMPDEGFLKRGEVDAWREASVDGGVLRSQDVSDGSARFKDRLQVQPKPGELGGKAGPGSRAIISDISGKDSGGGQDTPTNADIETARSRFAYGEMSYDDLQDMNQRHELSQVPEQYAADLATLRAWEQANPGTALGKGSNRRLRRQARAERKANPLDAETKEALDRINQYDGPGAGELKRVAKMAVAPPSQKSLDRRAGVWAKERAERSVGVRKLGGGAYVANNDHGAAMLSNAYPGEPSRRVISYTEPEVDSEGYSMGGGGRPMFQGRIITDPAELAKLNSPEFRQEHHALRVAEFNALARKYGAPLYESGQRPVSPNSAAANPGMWRSESPEQERLRILQQVTGGTVVYEDDGTARVDTPAGGVVKSREERQNDAIWEAQGDEDAAYGAFNIGQAIQEAEEKGYAFDPTAPNGVRRRGDTTDYTAASLDQQDAYLEERSLLMEQLNKADEADKGESLAALAALGQDNLDISVDLKGGGSLDAADDAALASPQVGVGKTESDKGDSARSKNLAIAEQMGIDVDTNWSDRELYDHLNTRIAAQQAEARSKNLGVADQIGMEVDPDWNDQELYDRLATYIENQKSDPMRMRGEAFTSPENVEIYNQRVQEIQAAREAEHDTRLDQEIAAAGIPPEDLEGIEPWNRSRGPTLKTRRVTPCGCAKLSRLRRT